MLSIFNYYELIDLMQVQLNKFNDNIGSINYLSINYVSRDFHLYDT